jgi:hypothetical protein
MLLHGYDLRVVIPLHTWSFPIHVEGIIQHFVLRLFYRYTNASPPPSCATLGLCPTDLGNDSERLQYPNNMTF